MQNGSSIVDSLTGTMAFAGGPPARTKLFNKPFRMVFEVTGTEQVTWIEVESLSGLRHVADRLDKGEIREIDQYTSLEMQLWGHLAEYVGFLREPAQIESPLSAGIQPLGAEVGELTNDMSRYVGSLWRHRRRL
jgi:hypothetical protein